MEILGDRKFVELPGSKTHELPPLLVRSAPDVKRLDKVMGMANDLIEQEDMMALLPDGPVDAERRRMDLALNLVDQYLGFVRHWQWGDSILEWIRQCETTFESRIDLRNILRVDVWPHAGRSSFVTLLEDKDVETGGVGIEKAVGMRLTFRQPPPLRCFSNQFLFYLNSTVATTAYSTWAGMTPAPVSALPPERFAVQVVDMYLD
ncbi:MAG TPA: hypothetical protein VNX18_03340 [Bryobacteraceae bacterium]|jgi:hypothetical protein|nr:hypothetical protein [Bryobacteraceae bacterium]